jgi:sulfur carrier protein
MTITLNGARYEVDDAITVTALIESIAGTTRGSAVAVDGEVVPRSSWTTYALRAGQTVELITAKQGG